MADQTRLFFEISRQKWEQIGPVQKSKAKGAAASKEKVPDRMAEECNSINKQATELTEYLTRIRPVYLSKTKKLGSDTTLTDKQREEIDYETRMIIQRQLGRLEELEKLEKQRIDRYQSRSAMQKFMSDADQETNEQTIEAHRQGMFTYLRERLKEASDLQASQQEIRLSRQLEKSKSTLHHVPQRAKPATPTVGGGAAIDEEKERESEFESTLSPQLQQELENENNALLDELELSLEKAKSAEKSMYEIAQLQTSLATHLASQNDMIHSLVEDAFNTTGDVTEANKQLDSAKERNRRTSQAIFWAALVIGLILLITDWIR